MNKLIFSFYDKKIKKAPMEIFYWLRLRDYKHSPGMAGHERNLRYKASHQNWTNEQLKIQLTSKSSRARADPKS